MAPVYWIRDCSAVADRLWHTHWYSQSMATVCGLSLTFSQSTLAGCSVHDHNCLHGSYPLDPTLGNVPSGSASLSIGTAYFGAPDLNQHVSLPSNRGPFLAAGPDGTPVTAALLGGGPNVVYHNQQSVQFSDGSAGAMLTSNPGSESTQITGNVAEGTYSVAIHNYDLPGSGLSGSFNTAIAAGGTGHFDPPAGSHVGSAYNYGTGTSGILAPNQVSGIFTFTFYNNGFNPHSRGVYVIPDGQWNLGGVPEPDQSTPGKTYLFEHANPTKSTESVVGDFLAHIKPLSDQMSQQFAGLVFQQSNGRTGLSLSISNPANLTTRRPKPNRPRGAFGIDQDSEILPGSQFNQLGSWFIHGYDPSRSGQGGITYEGSWVDSRDVKYVPGDVNHGYIVIGDSIGDPNAEIFSFGEDEDGNFVGMIGVGEWSV